MFGKFTKAGLFVLLLSAVLVGAAYAEEEIHLPQIKVIGEITAVNLDESTFAMNTRQGDDLRFLVIERTKFRSPEGSINGLGDLAVGMKALVVGTHHPEHGAVALMVAAGAPDDLPETFRTKGKVNGVDLQTESFSVLTESGESQRFKTFDRTQFRSRDGAVKGLHDLEIGMPVVVAAAKRDDGIPMALMVVAGSSADRPKRFEVIGEIENVIPGLNKFELQTRSGESLTILVSDRTKFRSRDGSIEDIHDLKSGMHAIVAGVVGEDGTHHALMVAAGDFTDDQPERPAFEIRAAGRITAIGNRTFTLQTRNQGLLTFVVDASTVYKSRDGNINSFDDLKVGMNAAVGGTRLDDGQLKALIVGVGQPKQDRAPRSADGLRDQQRELAPTDLG